MANLVNFDPYATSQPQNSFLLQTQGLTQGFAEDDSSTRMELSGGTLASTETMVMWGGVPVQEFINLNSATGAQGIGPALGRATSQGTVTGWSVFNQAGSMIITPGNSVPQAAVGNYFAFYRNVSNARVVVQLDPALVTSLEGVGGNGDPINLSGLYWDVTYYRVTLTSSGGNFALPTSARLLNVNQNSKIILWNSGASTVSWSTGSCGWLLI